ncbi:MAG: hypothetical protein GXP62_19200, partial [Oligoflexia bacterium]|nr:hypothetical protein [Oligoflexia bacterium]
EADPAQPLVQLNLGQRLRLQGDRLGADRLLTAAAKGGAEDAWYLLAELAVEDHRIFDARHYLDQYAASATGGISREAAAALSEQVDQQILLLKAVVGGVSGGILLLVLGLVVRRRISKPLSALIALAPEANHDLARLLSAIRHEVLKHNTTLLDEVALALEHGDHHAVAWAATRLYGASRDEPGVVDRFDDYLKAISRLGRKHGVRLDLRHRDPVLAPMWRAMRRLRRLAPVLRRPAKAGPDVPDRLRALSARLNDQGYRALGHLIQQMGRLHLDRGLLASVDARVRAEPAFEGADLPTLVLDLPPRPVPVRVFRGDLEDILANLLRNAYTAVIDGMGPGLRRVGVALREEDDPITGIEHVVIEVLDNAPGHLSDEMIRGRGIGRGLGLTVDLINRHDGSIHVGPPPRSAGLSYTKACHGPKKETKRDGLPQQSCQRDDRGRSAPGAGGRGRARVHHQPGAFPGGTVHLCAGGGRAGGPGPARCGVLRRGLPRHALRPGRAPTR